MCPHLCREVGLGGSLATRGGAWGVGGAAARGWLGDRMILPVAGRASLVELGTRPWAAGLAGANLLSGLGMAASSGDHRHFTGSLLGLATEAASVYAGPVLGEFAGHIVEKAADNALGDPDPLGPCS